jgi:hypothetical protein
LARQGPDEIRPSGLLAPQLHAGEQATAIGRVERASAQAGLLADAEVVSCLLNLDTYPR